MLQYEFENCIGHWICTTSHAMRRAMEARLVQKGMTLRQWEVLARLACEGNLSQTEMADRLGIEPPTLAGVLRRMERDGWLERSCCSNDRRKNNIRPTKQAEAVWNELTEICQQIREQAAAGLTEDDLVRLKATCEQIRRNLSDLDAVDAASHSDDGGREITAPDASPTPTLAAPS